jgi:hypothetical protein
MQLQNQVNGIAETLEHEVAMLQKYFVTLSETKDLLSMAVPQA